MDQSKDWIARYGIILGKRYTDYQRKRFLKAAQTEFATMGYDVDATISTVPYLKWEKKNFYNLYAGNLKKANLVISTYYDTSVKSFGAYRQAAFETDITQARSGVPNRWNMIRNTSSILAMIHLASAIPKPDRKKIAFAFVDGGSNSGYGHEMMRDYFIKSKAIFVTLDSIGNPGKFQWFTNKDIQVDPDDEIHQLPERWSECGDVLLSSGSWKNKRIIIHNANTRKDKDLDEEKVLECAERLRSIVKQLST